MTILQANVKQGPRKARYYEAPAEAAAEATR